MRHLQRIVELVVAAAMLLTGCQWQLPMTKFDEMEYVRPDMQEYRTLLEAVVVEAEAGEDFGALEEALWDYTNCYNDYYTNYALADIRYCMDLTDIYWTDEYDYFMETYAEVDAGQISWTTPWRTAPSGRSWKRRTISARASLMTTRAKASGTRNLRR